MHGRDHDYTTRVLGNITEESFFAKDSTSMRIRPCQTQIKNIIIVSSSHSIDVELEDHTCTGGGRSKDRRSKWTSIRVGLICAQFQLEHTRCISFILLPFCAFRYSDIGPCREGFPYLHFVFIFLSRYSCPSLSIDDSLSKQC